MVASQNPESADEMVADLLPSADEIPAGQSPSVDEIAAANPVNSCNAANTNSPPSNAIMTAAPASNHCVRCFRRY